MQQLSGLDASFLYLETPNAPMHISSLCIYDQSTAPNGQVRFKELIRNYVSRIKGVPSMTRKLVTVPLGLDHPYWITDGDFDPEFHIRHVALPKPGDWRQLCIMVSRIHARPLDRNRPLWEAWVIEGLDKVEGVPKGSFAVFSKTHHAAIDGASGMEILAAVHDLNPDYQASAGGPTVEKERAPGRLGLLVRAQINAIKQPFRFLSVARNTVPGMARAVLRLGSGELERVSKVPRTRFNGTVSAHRVFDAVSFPLQQVKEIKNAVEGATVNDVALTICGGALRKYLEASGELPDQSLVAMAPINVRTKSEGGGDGNVISTMAVRVRSDIADPLERLRKVHEGTVRSKHLSGAVGAKTMTDYSQFIPSTITAQAARLASSLGLANQVRPVFNCVVTNVPGPQVPLYNTGARMVASFGTGPVVDSLGLFHVISSYCGMFTISATSCREMMPDPEIYCQCLQDSFDELREACEAIETAPTKPARKPAKRKSTVKKAG